MWLNKEEISYNAFLYCRDIKDDPKIRKYIMGDPAVSLSYCLEVERRSEVEEKIYENLNAANCFQAILREIAYGGDAMYDIPIHLRQSYNIPVDLRDRDFD